MRADGLVKRSEKQTVHMRPVSCHRALHGRELFGRRHARLVAQHVLASPHRRDCDVGPVARHGGQHDEVDRGVVQQPLARDGWHLREALLESGQNPRVGGYRVVSDAGLPSGEQSLGQVVDMPMIKSDRGEARHGLVLRSQAGMAGPPGQCPVGST